MQESIKRRAFLATGVITALSEVHVAESTESSVSSVPWRVGFNTSTIREYKLSLEEEIEIAYKAGFRSVELWSERIRKYRDQGKSLAELRKRMDDRGMTAESLIGFATWIVNDPQQRRQGLETMREEMLFVTELGAACIAAPASGAWKEKIEGIEVCAQRYRDVLDLGRETAVRPMLELWGTSPTLSKLSDLLAIAAAAKRSNAAILLDAYHLYRGGNSFESLALVAGSAMPVF
ncbi:MAG: TIM barrel protein, partial [Planctomycetia bacterium]|nr:TIM barrel protein [Planctomycetia bacterium]